MKISNEISGVAIGFLLAVGACASSFRPTIAQLDRGGVTPAALSVKPARDVEFVNRDARPHQIYSNDCGELSSTVIQPGEKYDATVGLGPKVCHFQDLLNPGASAYRGTVAVGGGILDWAP